MSRSLPLRLGCAYSFQYPRYNYLGLPANVETRRVVIEEIRDTTSQPLDSQTVATNPLLKRGRWLVTGHDLDRDAFRSFYFDSMSNVRLLTEEQCDPFRRAAYIVLTALGQAVFQGSHLGDALNVLLKRPTGILCRVVGRSS